MSRNKRIYMEGIPAFTALALIILLLADRLGLDMFAAARFIGGRINVLFLTFGYLSLLGLAMYRHQWRDIWLALATCAAVTIVVQAVKLLWTAPMALRPNGSPGGFPSGHAAASFALAYLLARSFPRLSPVWYLVAVVISWSRVEAHAHWAFQVLISVPLGLAIAWYLDSRMSGEERGIVIEDEQRAAA